MPQTFFSAPTSGMRLRVLAATIALTVVAPLAADTFSESIRPTLVEHCSACHNPANTKQRIQFLKAKSAPDLSNNRALWRSVATQIRNRTMPPGASKFSEHDRLETSRWIESYLRQTACGVGEFAAPIAPRRLNRREYRNTIRDLLGVDFDAAGLFPADGAGGEGFDTNSSTLFLAPLLIERYFEAADRILERAIVSPPFERLFDAPSMQPPKATLPGTGRELAPGEAVSANFTVYTEADYSVLMQVDRAREKPIEFSLEVDGKEVGRFKMEIEVFESATARTARVHLAKGSHLVVVKTANDSPALSLFDVQITQQYDPPGEALRFAHYRLLGLEPGETPLRPRTAAQRFLTGFLPRAYRRAVEPLEITRFLTVFDRSAERGEPYEQSLKLALKAILVSPSFLFRVEQAPAEPGPQPLNDHELAVRLSYFLWSSPPDEELRNLADAGKLADEPTLAAQVDRLLDHPRSRVFVESFIGQWLGTKEVGGRVAPTVNAIQHFYTPKIAADLRAEPIVNFQHMIEEDRSLLEFIDADYTFLTRRLATHYSLPVDGLKDNEFTKHFLDDKRRGGLLGLGAVLAMNAHFKESSPVLRGAWVLDTMLGTPVPPPPPEVPALETGDNDESGLDMRTKIERHREDPSCAACHDLIDPIGFALENYDFLGRWRDDDEGRPIDTSAKLPGGEEFLGPAGLRKVLLKNKHEFVRQITSKMLGYALGRGLEDGDDCTVRTLSDTLAENNYSARTLIHGIAHSTPFRYTTRPPNGE